MPVPSLRIRRPVALALLAALLGATAACSSSVESSDPTGGSGGSGGAPATKPLSLGTWNVRNLFDEQKNNGVPFEDVDPNYATRRKALAKVIDSLNPAIFVLQEVESQKVLDELNGELALPYQHTKLIDGNDPRGIDVAVLSRLPLDKVVSHQNDTFIKAGTSEPSYKYSRDCLEIHVTRNGRHVVLLGVHFRSKVNDNPDHRLAEAQHTRVIANGLAKDDPSAAIVVLGDFNDSEGSAPVAVLKDGSPALSDVTDVLPESDRWSYKFDGQFLLIDHILVTPNLVDMLDAASVQIARSTAIDAASDHDPVLATFNVY